MIRKGLRYSAVARSRASTPSTPGEWCVGPGGERVVVKSLPQGHVAYTRKDPRTGKLEQVAAKNPPAKPVPTPKKSNAVDFSQNPEWHAIAYGTPSSEDVAKLSKWLKDNSRLK